MTSRGEHPESVTAALPIAVVRHPRARCARLSIDPATGAVRLTLPPRAALAPAMRWAAEKQAWIAAERAKLPPARPFVDGGALPFRGETLTIRWDAGAPRRIAIVGNELKCGGPIDSLSARIARWLRAEALALLSAETAEFAARAGVDVSRVSIGDPASRWGSCSSRGAIRYSWRLILAPDFVRRATVAHEVAHRVHMHHGPTFHALVAELVGVDADRSRAWLKRHGAALHWVGRSG